MSTEMVEAKRKYVDMEAGWKKQRLKKKAGPGGLLSVTIVQARDLRSAHEGCERAQVLAAAAMSARYLWHVQSLEPSEQVLPQHSHTFGGGASWHSIQQCHACTLLTPCSPAWCLLL